MTTLKQLFQTFGHAPKWGRLATQSAQPMVSVFMRKLGDTDITTLTDFDIEMQLAMSEQPEDRKVKARSCMHYLLRWAREQGKEVPQIAHPFEIKEQETKNEKDNAETDTELRLHRGRDASRAETDGQPKEEPKSDTACGRIRPVRHVRPAEPEEHREVPRHEGNQAPRTRKPRGEGETRRKRTETKAQPKASGAGTKERKKAERQLTHRPTKEGDTQIARRKADVQMTLEDWQADTRPRHGTIEHDTSSKGWKNGKRVFKDCWRAVITVNGQRYRHRGKTREECREWLKAVCAKKILPTDNKADWWRMEQRKDEEARIDELIVSAAEEANIVYEYRQTGDTEILYNYCIKALLPHMVYYCAHSLHLGRDRSLTCSRQAVGLILTKIVGGRPVTNITFTCKRMLRTYKNRGDFWYYDKAPEAVKLMVNRIDMSALADLYKVTKDRRI